MAPLYPTPSHSRSADSVRLGRRRAFLQWSCSFSSLPTCFLYNSCPAFNNILRGYNCSYGHSIDAGVQRHHLLHICSISVRDEPLNVYTAQDRALLTICFVQSLRSNYMLALATSKQERLSFEQRDTKGQVKINAGARTTPALHFSIPRTEDTTLTNSAGIPLALNFIASGECTQFRALAAS